MYHFPELYLTELSGIQLDDKQPRKYSVSEAALSELKTQKNRAEMARFRAKLADMNARAREEALDRPPPATVRAYREVDLQLVQNLYIVLWTAIRLQARILYSL